MPSPQMLDEMSQTLAQKTRLIEMIKAAQARLDAANQKAESARTALITAEADLKAAGDNAAPAVLKPLQAALAQAQAGLTAADKEVKQAKEEHQELLNYLKCLPDGGCCKSAVPKDSPLIMLVSFALVIIILGAVIWPGSALLSSLSYVETGRGLVTFLVTASTAAIAFMLIYHAFMPGTVPERFRMAREIFTALIGILGTIIGYYFGVPKEADAGPPPAIEVEAAFDSATSTLSGEVKGGTPPYAITVGSKPGGVGVSGISITVGADGRFSQKLPEPAEDGCLVLTTQNGDARHPVTAIREITVKKRGNTAPDNPGQTGGDAGKSPDSKSGGTAEGNDQKDKDKKPGDPSNGNNDA